MKDLQTEKGDVPNAWLRVRRSSAVQTIDWSSGPACPAQGSLSLWGGVLNPAKGVLEMDLNISIRAVCQTEPSPEVPTPLPLRLLTVREACEHTLETGPHSCPEA